MSDNNGLPTFSRTNIVAAIVIAGFSAGVVACTLYAPELGRLATVISLFLIVAAGILHIPLSNVAVSQMNIESAPNMQTTIEAPAPAEAAPPVKRSHHAKPPLSDS